MSCMISTVPCLLRSRYRALPGWTQKRWATVKHGRGTGRPKGKRSYWTPERLATLEQYPLTAMLHDAMHPGRLPVTPKSSTSDTRPKKTTTKRTTSKTQKEGEPLKPLNRIPSSVHVRTQIVSPELCDDILKQIGHTLANHRGCDILDINPGACLWSQKLHDYLNPRSHVLLEPSPELFKDFLNPLLGAPDSKYKLVDKDPKLVTTYREIMNEDYFPNQKRVDPEDQDTLPFNNRLLVTGSLAWDPRLPGLGFDSMAKQLYHHFSSAAWYNDLFHAFGHVQTLFWVQQDDFSSAFAQSISTLQKANRQLELTHDVNMIVSPERKARTAGRGGNVREPQYEMESLIRALKSGRASGSEAPPHRRDYVYQFAEHFNAETRGTGIVGIKPFYEYAHAQHLKGTEPTGLLSQSLINSTKLGMQLAEKYPGQFKDPFDPTLKKRNHLKSENPDRDEDVAEYHRSQAATMGVIRTKVHVEELADIGEQMYILECKALKTASTSKRAELFKQIEDLEVDLETKKARVHDNYRHLVDSEIDDRLNLRYPPHPRIQWDSRPFEPLIMREHEVWPQNRLALVSTTPKPRPAHADTEWVEWLLDFVYALYRDPSMPLPAALDTMQHGLSDIIKDCPTLRDPEAGGRMQMKHLRVRLLTDTMLEELVSAYKDWPFKSPGSDHSKYFRHKGQKSTF